MSPDDLRQKWFAFFEERGHARVPSDSLVPENDPTLLFTGAGMNQFKAQFVGKGDLTHRRVTTIQKCFRQGDLENVGRTPRHLTFFEMMGHFSFGDYFKKEAIAWAWEFLLEVVRLPKDKLWVSVYADDDVAADAWRSAGVPAERIARFGASENFWPADAPSKGPNGPCGPCTEIFYDYGEAFAVGDGGSHQYDSGRFVEIWNSVFTQFDRQEDGTLLPLPQTNIDCGAGFERVLAAKLGEVSPFGTPLFRPIVDAVAALCERPYAWRSDGGLAAGEDARRMRRIAEHARAMCFLVMDGVKPGNEGRGYVLRRVMRRAIRDGIQLGLDTPFLAELVPVVLDTMGAAYPALAEGRKVLASVLEGEDIRFRQTYDKGLRYLEEEIARLGSAKTLDGAAAFKLYDTYGFPLDLAQVILEERGLTVDEAGFEVAMTQQRERARAGAKMTGDIFAGGPLLELKDRGAEATEFSGYGNPGLEDEAVVVGIVQAGALVATAAAGAQVTVILDRTPFYAESGGQVGDTGRLEAAGLAVVVTDTVKKEGYHLHEAVIEAGTLTTGATLHARVDRARRDAVRRNHTATHLLHEALKRVLGPDVRQEGSLVAEDRLRFDFRHDRALTEEQLTGIEDLVNAWILANDEVRTNVMDLSSAKASGAVSLFGEKYDDLVRVLAIDSGSRELCGGTHCFRTGDIGSFRVTLEISVAAGVRRMEAVTGSAATALAGRDRGIVGRLTGTFKSTPEEILGRVEALQEEIKALKKAAEKIQREAGAQAAASLADGAETVGALRVLAASVPGVDAKGLKGVWDTLHKKGVAAAALIGEQGDKAPVFVAMAPDAVAAGFSAKTLLGVLTAVLGGGGGGSPQQAQGQGQDRSAIEDALAAARKAFHAPK
ncbi:MAG: alanine--tRNA ligase [Planctomycetota bacterium]|nr:alanine--tRNA ligase [Planctomycetota bacterium]